MRPPFQGVLLNTGSSHHCSRYDVSFGQSSEMPGFFFFQWNICDVIKGIAHSTILSKIITTFEEYS